ncbi:protease TldD [Salmonella enterica subsp. enterica]|uniref:Protease TldD n=1 Tax=Salmonella enterica I TaxID=59201 RepID=A0A447P658_SALET|nr:protease TldD [Salmonella enterica subsp. enterica]
MILTVRGTSVFSGQIGEQVASALCTVVDDGTMMNRRGSVAIDDEGTPGQYNVLIENGVLKGYMQDKLNARLMGATPTGNGRRESYAHLPMPRMTNTLYVGGAVNAARKLSNPLSTASMRLTLAAVRWISPPASLCSLPRKRI